MPALIIFASILLFFSASYSSAGEVTEIHSNVRSKGMGGVWMSIVNDQDAVFVNPAALAKVSGFDWNVLSAEVGINGLQTYDELKGIDTANPSSYGALYGKQIWLHATAKTAMAFPNLAFGAYNESNATLELHNPAFPQFQTHFISDNGIVLGGAFNIAPGLNGGLALKQISRWGGDKDIDLGVIAGGNVGNIDDQFENKGRGYGVDLALQTVLPLSFAPVLSAVWQDVGSTAFTQTAGTEAPPRIRDNLSFGLSSSIDLPGIDLVGALEYRHATESEYQFGQKVHFGAEISLPIFDIRGGISQGYASYGLGFNFLFLRVDVAQYTEEMGAYAGQSPQQRLQGGISIDLGFDADFNLTDKDGKTRKLKQRR